MIDNLPEISLYLFSGIEAVYTPPEGEHLKQVCAFCKTEMISTQEQVSQSKITGGVCPSCVKQFVKSNAPAALRLIIDSIDTPILLMQPEPRQVYTANKKALELFNKELPQLEAHRGGQVFDCIHAYTELGCGKDVHCEDCKIKNAVVETFTTGRSFDCVSTFLEIKRQNEITTYVVQVSTEKIGDFELLRIDQYKKKA